MNCKDIWDTRSEKTKKRKCRSAESSFQVNLSKMINLSLLYAACWRDVRQTILLFPVDWYMTYFLVSKLQHPHFYKLSRRWTPLCAVPDSPWTFSVYRPHQQWNEISPLATHISVPSSARRVPSSNTKNINGLFLFYAQTQCFSPLWSSAPGNLSTVLILLVCTDQDQICAYERLMNEVLCLMKTSVKRCFLK